MGLEEAFNASEYFRMAEPAVGLARVLRMKHMLFPINNTGVSNPGTTQNSCEGIRKSVTSTEVVALWRCVELARMTTTLLVCLVVPVNQ